MPVLRQIVECGNPPGLSSEISYRLAIRTLGGRGVTMGCSNRGSIEKKSYTSNRSMSSLYNLRYPRQTVGDIKYYVLRFSKGDGDIVLEESLPREAIIVLWLNPKSHQLTKCVLLGRGKFVVMYV